MKPMHGTTVRCAWLLAWALGVVPLGAQPRPGDRVYTADQVSNTVSVIDPVRNELLGVLPLGDPFPAGLSPLYRGALLVHGLGFSPDGRTLAVVSIGSNSVTLLETATLRVRATVYVGRAPHEAFFTPDGRELWVAVRGENYVSVIDPNAGREVRRIPTADGPAMVLFRPDGRYAFVPSSFVPELTVIDVRAHRPVARVRQVSAFSPNLAVSRDGREVWVTLKDVGKVQVIEARPPFATKAVLETGPITNHVALVDAPTGSFAYVTVGGATKCRSTGEGRCCSEWPRSRWAICLTAYGRRPTGSGYTSGWKTATRWSRSTRARTRSWLRSQWGSCRRRSSTCLERHPRGEIAPPFGRWGRQRAGGSARCWRRAVAADAPASSSTPSA